MSNNQEEFISGKNYIDFFNAVPFAIYIWKIEDTKIYLAKYNDAALIITKGKIQPLLGCEATEYYRNNPQILYDFEKCCTQKVDILREIEYTSDFTGDEKSFIFYYKFIKPNLIFEYTEDITLYKNTEKSLNAERERTNQYLNTAGVIILALDIEGNIKLLNKKGYEVIEYNEGELDGKNWFRICIPPFQKDEIYSIFKHLIKGDAKKAEFYENPIITKNGKEKLVAWRNKILYNKNGNIIGTISSGEDITLKKYTEKKLEESENRFRSIIENMPMGVHMYQLNRDGQLYFTGANPAADKILGINNTKYIGKTINEAFPEISKTEIPDKFRNLTEKGGFWYKKNIIYENQSIKEAFENYNFQTSSNQMVSLFMDITDRILAEEKLRTSRKKYKLAYDRADFYKDLFAHDINNILQNILFASEMANSYCCNADHSAEIEEYFNIIEEQINRGSCLVLNINKLSLLDEMEIKLKQIEIIQPLTNTVKLIKELYRNKDINIKMDIPFKEIVIIGNDFIVDVFENLLFNAIKHNKNKNIKINIIVSKIAIDNNKYIKLVFEDNANGIADLEKKRIFKRNKNKNYTKRRIGIGLSLVQKIVEKIEGKIWVEDRIKGEYQKGSKFILLIPNCNK